MSSIQKVFDCVDIRKKIFNLKSQSIKQKIKNNYDNLLKELEYNLDNVYECRCDLWFPDIKENIVINFTRNEFYNALIDNLCEDYFDDDVGFWIIDSIKENKIIKKNNKKK